MSDHPSPQAAARRAVALIGGPSKSARVLGVKDGRHQTVQSWLRTRVPAEYCPLIERATGGRVRCEDLRPDVAWAIVRASPCLASRPIEARLDDTGLSTEPAVEAEKAVVHG